MSAQRHNQLTNFMGRDHNRLPLSTRLSLGVALSCLVLGGCGGPIVTPSAGSNATASPAPSSVNAIHPTPSPCPDSMSCKVFKRLAAGRQTPEPAADK
ncbi:MAG: hypothetical protein M1546_15010 [Chloroflexi bacterium]|nr:hypothetical protein [Chloroflexota bacterium]